MKAAAHLIVNAAGAHVLQRPTAMRAPLRRPRVARSGGGAGRGRSTGTWARLARRRAPDRSAARPRRARYSRLTQAGNPRRLRRGRGAEAGHGGSVPSRWAWPDRSAKSRASSRKQLEETAPAPRAPSRGAKYVPPKKGSRAAVSHTLIGQPPLPVQRLDDAHVDRVDVGALLAVDLDADVVLVEVAGDLLVLEALLLHHVAPVAGRVADREKTGRPRRCAPARRPRRPRETSFTGLCACWSRYGLGSRMSRFVYGACRRGSCGACAGRSSDPSRAAPRGAPSTRRRARGPPRTTGSGAARACTPAPLRRAPPAKPVAGEGDQ